MELPKPYEVKDIVPEHRYIDPFGAVVIKDPDHVPLIEGTFIDMAFTRTSDIHGRTWDDPGHYVFTGEPVKDEFGDIYTAFSIKGAFAGLPTAHYHDIEPNGVRVNGMLDADVFEHCREVSRVLREDGVLTEWPIFQARPAMFPDGEKDIPLEAFRKMVYDAYLYHEALKADLRLNPAISTVPPPDGIGKAGIVGAALADMNFGVMYRGMLSNVRVGELTEIKDEAAVAGHVSAAIRALQARQPIHFAAWKQLAELNPDSPADRQTYLTETLPALQGENLARSQVRGVHKYTHPNNWTLAAELVDLDSFECPQLYPDSPSKADLVGRFKDIYETAGGLQHISTFTGEPQAKISLEFYDHYFAERILADGLTPVEAVLLDSIVLPRNKADMEPPHILDLGDQNLYDLTDHAIEGYDGLMVDPQDIPEHLLEGYIHRLVTPYAAERVKDYLRSNGLARVIGELGVDNFANVEAAKFVYFLDGAAGMLIRKP